MEDKSQKEKIGLYLNLKIILNVENKKYGIYDYSSGDEKIINLNTFITEKAFLVKDKNNNIKLYENQRYISIQNEKILFYIRIRNNKIILEKEGAVFPDDNLTLRDIFKNHKELDVNEKNIKALNECFWKVINSDTIENPNGNYYLNENDIIKIGYLKYFVREINIKKRKNDGKQKQIFNLIPYCYNYKKCDEQCNEKCNEYCNKHCNCNKERYCLCQCGEKYGG
jgi:hypothetical protein